MNNDSATPPSAPDFDATEWDRARECNDAERAPDDVYGFDEPLPHGSSSVDAQPSAMSPEERLASVPSLVEAFPRARQKYEEAGASTVHSAFELANILHTDKKVLEASELYRIAFDLHNKRPDHYPLAHSLLQVRLLCLLKAGRRIPDKELSELSKLSIPYANYIGGVDLAWREQLPEEALKLIGNSFEEFHTGEEIDSIYLEIARQVFGSTIGGDSPVGECAIPYKLYMYWDKNPPPEIQSNFDYHNSIGYLPVKIFDREEAAEWLYQNYGIEARELFLTARHPAEAADFLRVHVINRLGGWWLDADLKLKEHAARQFMQSSRCAGQYFTTSNYVVHNDFFGSSANSPLLNDCLLSLYRNCYLHKGLFIAYKTGPGVFNRAFSRLYHNTVAFNTKIPMIQIHNQQDFDACIEEFDTPYKHTTPHWQSM